MSSNSFRDYLLPADAPRILAARNVDVATYGARMLATERRVTYRPSGRPAWMKRFAGSPLTAGYAMGFSR